MKNYSYDYEWDILTHNYIFDGKHSKMGHASYASDSVDFDSETAQFFKEPEDVIAFDFWEEFGERDINQITKDFEEKPISAPVFDGSFINDEEKMRDFDELSKDKAYIDSVIKENADKALEILKANGENAYVLGEIIESDEGVVLC